MVDKSEPPRVKLADFGIANHWHKGEVPKMKTLAGGSLIMLPCTALILERVGRYKMQYFFCGGLGKCLVQYPIFTQQYAYVFWPADRIVVN